MKQSLTILVLFLGFVLGCTQKPHEISKITPTEAQGLLANDFAVLVDVREEDEVASGMAAPAKWIPMSQFEASLDKVVEQLPKNKQVIFYCAGGGRSKKAAEIFAAKGYNASFFNSIDDWKRAGLPVKMPK